MDGLHLGSVQLDRWVLAADVVPSREPDLVEHREMMLLRFVTIPML